MKVRCHLEDPGVVSDEHGMVSLNDEQRELLDKWSTIPKEQKATLLELLSTMGKVPIYAGPADK